MSSAELSIDIAQLVSRARAGEAIDATVEGETLHAKYPGLGMSAELIGKAVTRAAAMMGVDVDGPREPNAAILADQLESGFGHPAESGRQSGAGETFDPAEAPALVALQDETLAPAGAAVAESVGGDVAKPILPGPAEDGVPPDVSAAEPAEPERELDEVLARSGLRRPVAAMRRAFFGA